MPDVPEVWLVRHGETEWSASGRHTSRTDVMLTESGREAARSVAARLRATAFDRVLTSPLGRARRTAELAGWADAEVVDDLREWDYGTYEGSTTAHIRESVPGWSVWTHETPGGESADDVGRRLDRVVEMLRREDGRVLVFGHGHSLRVLAARWLGQPATAGRLYRLDTTTVSVLGYEHGTSVLRSWNA